MISRNKITIGLLLAAVVGLSFVAERVTLPDTTDRMRAQADAYITEYNIARPPNAFVYDGCTLFPDSLLGLSFHDACLTHDIAYWAGGPISERKSVDVAFRDTISHTNKIGYTIAPAMYMGVRVFGDTFLTKLCNANWGYGWNK